MDTFSPFVTSVLLENGWNPSQNHDISDLKKAWQSSGFPWFESTETFLSEFCRVAIYDIEFDGKLHSIYVSFFDNMKIWGATEDQVNEMYKYLDPKYRNQLSPLGVICEGGDTLFIDSENNFYIGFISGQRFDLKGKLRRVLVDDLPKLSQKRRMQIYENPHPPRQVYHL